MKKFLLIAGLLGILWAVPSANAADMNGTWKGAFDFNGNSVPLTLTLHVTGTTVEGTVEGMPTTPAEIHDGKVDGDTITFWVNTDYQGQTYKITYKGKASADQIDFNFGTEDGSFAASMVAKKGGAQEPAASAMDVTGIYKGSLDVNGTTVPLTFNLKSAGLAVTGTMEGTGATPIEIHDGKLDGDTLTFWLDSPYQGQTYRLEYKGKVTPGQIDFSLGIPDGSWSATVTVKKT